MLPGKPDELLGLLVVPPPDKGLVSKSFDLLLQLQFLVGGAPADVFGLLIILHINEADLLSVVTGHGVHKGDRLSSESLGQ